MYQNKRILALIPARGGSKGIKNKNIIPLKGKPLIEYTIRAALECNYVDETIVSTDSERIADVSIKAGASVPFMRPSILADDTSRTIDVVLYTIEKLSERGQEYDVLVLLQPTSPLRDSRDISASIEAFFCGSQKGMLSVSEVDDNPVLIRAIKDNVMSRLVDINSTVRRQDMQAYYKVNGAIYINAVNELSIDTSFNDNKDYYIMEKSHSVDIDEYIDIAVAEYYLQSFKG